MDTGIAVQAGTHQELVVFGEAVIQADTADVGLLSLLQYSASPEPDRRVHTQWRSDCNSSCGRDSTLPLTRAFLVAF